MMFDGIRRSLQRRRQAYRAVFIPGAATDIVVADLKKFCRATTTPAVVSMITQQIDPMATGIAIGRQEVWHRIAQHLNISDEDLYRIIGENGDSDE